MGKKFISIIVLLMCSALCFATVPKWFVNLENEFPTDKYIRATGEGDSDTSAKQAALTNLSVYFPSSFESKTYAQSNKTKKNSNYTSNASIEQNTMVSTATEFFVVHYTQTYYDKAEKKYSVCAYIDKAEAFDIISQKISFYEHDFFQTTTLARTEREDFRKLIILSGALSNEDEIKTLYKYSLFIDSKKTQKFDEFLTQLNKTKTIIFDLKQRNPVFVFSYGDHSEEIKSIISEMLTEKGFIISKNADYKITSSCSFNISEQVTARNIIYSCRPTISVLIEGKNETISSCVLSSENISSYNEQTLTRMALAETENLLNEKLFQNLLK